MEEARGLDRPPHVLLRLAHHLAHHSHHSGLCAARNDPGLGAQAHVAEALLEGAMHPLREIVLIGGVAGHGDDH
eukprot:935749-Prymnesium_polylepis.2